MGEYAHKRGKSWNLGHWAMLESLIETGSLQGAPSWRAAGQMPVTQQVDDSLTLAIGVLHLCFIIRPLPRRKVKFKFYPAWEIKSLNTKE